MGLPRLWTPEVPQKSKLSLPPTLGDAQLTFKFAAGTGELRECDVNDHHSLALLCQKLMAVSIYSKNSQEL